MHVHVHVCYSVIPCTVVAIILNLFTVMGELTQCHSMLLGNHAWELSGKKSWFSDCSLHLTLYTLYFLFTCTCTVCTFQ